MIDVSNVIRAYIDHYRDSPLSRCELWPSQGSLPPDSSGSALIGLARANMPAHSGNGSGIWDPGGHGPAFFESSTSGRFTEYDSIQIGNLMVSIRFPSGFIATVPVPVFQPPVIPAYP